MLAVLHAGDARRALVGDAWCSPALGEMVEEVMDICDVTEADESATSKEAALRALEAQVMKNETHGIIAMYEMAALEAGATVAETEAIISRGRHG